MQTGLKIQFGQENSSDVDYYKATRSWYKENKRKLSPLRRRVFRIWLKIIRRVLMNEQRFQDEIRKKALTEYKIDIHILGRVGDEHPGWAENNVAAVVPTAIMRKGIMVDKIQ